jgi:hypothetical protein
MSPSEQPDPNYRDVSPGDVWRAIDELYEGLEGFALDPVSRARLCARTWDNVDVLGVEECEEICAQSMEDWRSYPPRLVARATRIRERLNALWRDWAARPCLEEARRRLVEIDVELDALRLGWDELCAAWTRRLVDEDAAPAGAVFESHDGGEWVPVVVTPAERRRALGEVVARDRRELAAMRRRLFARRALLGVTVPSRRPIRARARGCCGHARRRRSRAPPGDADCDGDDGPHVEGRRRRGWAP